MPRKKREVDPVIAQERAARLKCLREMTGLSRDMFKQRYNIARGTLQNWESARFGGLTRKGAIIVVRAFRAEGVDVTLDWLLHGLGQEPQFSGQISQTVSTPHTHQTDTAAHSVAAQELLYFNQNNSDSIYMVVADDSMCPRYKKGDFVAGNRRYQQEIESAIGFNCIVQTVEGGTMIRNLRAGDEPDRYHLFSLNWHSAIARPVLYNIEVLAAAPIIWTRTVTPTPIESYTPALQESFKEV